MTPATVTKKKRKTGPQKGGSSGRLRIGDNWNAITIIALSQTNPLKAIAEFVENSIDAKAKNITIVRGKEDGEFYLKVIDDGDGIPLNDEGIPDFKYVATHICDSIKRRLKKEGIEGIQGEFGIGLLSFWTVGERMILASAGSDERTYQMEMKKNEPDYTITQKRSLFSQPGTELIVHPLLSGIRLLHDFDTLETEEGEIYIELYLNAPSPDNTISLYRSGTRVLPSISKLDFFNAEPWLSGYLQGIIDVPFLQISPGTRDGIVHDEHFLTLCTSIETMKPELEAIIEQEKKAEEEEASRKILTSIQKALREAFLSLSQEDYDWFDIYADTKKTGTKHTDRPGSAADEEAEQAQILEKRNGEADALDSKEFFEYSGPLYKLIISPASSIVKVKTSKNLRCIPRDRNKRIVEHNVDIRWEIKEGEGALTSSEKEIVTFTAPEEPGLTILEATATQGEIVCSAESIITIAETLIEKPDDYTKGFNKGLPGYTYRRAPGELWRSQYDEKNNLVIINNGHSDYLFASKKQARKLKYICRLFAKELVLKNFMGFSNEELLERMIELSLYTEEHLK